MLIPILGHQWNQMRWFHNDGQRDGGSLYWGTGYFGMAANGSGVVAHHGHSFGVGHVVGIGPASVSVTYMKLSGPGFGRIYLHGLVDGRHPDLETQKRGLVPQIWLSDAHFVT